MLKASHISLYKIMTAGYLSAEAYSMLKPKKYYYEISINDCSLYPNTIAAEIRHLLEDQETNASLCGMEQMEACLFNYSDERPYELLEELLISTAEEVKQLLLCTGFRYFLLEYVFCKKESLSTKAFINDNNLRLVSDFIRKYEDTFIQTFSTGNLESSIIVKASMSFNDIQNNSVIGEQLIEGGNSEMCKVDEPTPCKFVISIDNDALSPNNAGLKKYVDVLSKMTDEEFCPFQKYFESKLATIPIRITHGIKAYGYQRFYVNYLFAKDAKLLNLRNIGWNSIIDFRKIRGLLIDNVIQCIDNADSVEYTMTDETADEQNLKNLTLEEIVGSSQYEALVKILHKLAESLSVRARNAIENYKGDFIEDFVHRNKNILSLNNVGRKTSEEISALVEQLKIQVAEIKAKECYSPVDFQILGYELFFEDCWDDFSRQYYLDNQHLPMFHLLENWIGHQKERDWSIVKSALPVYEGVDPRKIAELAGEFGISKERCRQICRTFHETFNKVVDKDLVSENISFSKFLGKTEEWQYLIKSVSCKKMLEIDSVCPYLKDEQCHLSKEFGFFVLVSLLDNEYSLVGREVLSLPSRFKVYWNNSYLIKNEYASAFDFESLPKIIKEVEGELSEDIEQNAEDLVIDTFFFAWNNFDTDKVYDVSEILSDLLIKEFGKLPNDQFQFKLEAKKELSATAVIYDILRKNGDPMTTDEVFAKLETFFPNTYKSPDSVKSLIRSDSRIRMTGVANYVGLLEWNHVQFGSIRDIIVEYLSTFNKPMPALEIAENVQKYRNASENSIRASLSSGDQFVHFEGSLYGLKGKCYPARYNKPKKNVDFASRVKDMETFIKEHSRFPLRNYGDKIEDSLYVWWRRVIIKKNLDDYQKSEIERIQKKYKDYPSTKRENEWFAYYEKFKAFVQQYCRKPRHNRFHEKPLYDWFEKCKDDFAEERLSSEMEKLYIELCELL